MNLSLAHPLKVHIAVHYKRDVPEHYDLLISPVSAAEVCVRLHSPVVGETSCRLHPWSAKNHESMSMCAIQSVVGCFFGDIHAAPRIVGAPDWEKVQLEVCVIRDSRARRLMLLELESDSPTRAVFVRANGRGVIRDESVRLCPEDADPVYAVTRLALSSKALAPVERPSARPAPLRTPLRQPARAGREMAATA